MPYALMGKLGETHTHKYRNILQGDFMWPECIYSFEGSIISYIIGLKIFLVKKIINGKYMFGEDFNRFKTIVTIYRDDEYSTLHNIIRMIYKIIS